MWYILKGRKYFKSTDLRKCDDHLKDRHSRRIASDFIPDEKRKEMTISTVFLSLDHNMGGSGGGPVLFETMCFGGKIDENTNRYSSWDDAFLGHIRMTEQALFEYLKIDGQFKPMDLKALVYTGKIKFFDETDDTITDCRLIVDDGIHQPSTTFGVFNNIFYKRMLWSEKEKSYKIFFWEIGDPKCDILKEVSPYSMYFKK
jgi:uncharacterized protein YjhX (UPF0386 family)